MGIFPKLTYGALHGDQASVSLPHPWSRQEMSSPPPLVVISPSNFDFPLKQLLEALMEFLKDMCSNSFSLMFCPKGLHHCFLVFSHTLKRYSFSSFPSQHYSCRKTAFLPISHIFPLPLPTLCHQIRAWNSLNKVLVL